MRHCISAMACIDVDAVLYESHVHAVSICVDLYPNLFLLIYFMITQTTQNRNLFYISVIPVGT